MYVCVYVSMCDALSGERLLAALATDWEVIGTCCPELMASRVLDLMHLCSLGVLEGLPDG